MNNTEHKIVKFPAKSLRKNVRDVKIFTDTEREILSDMARIMYMNSGVGLAANQIDIDARLVVMDIGKGLIKMANPLIVKKEGSDIHEEGCLSIPQVSVKVKRAKKVVVDFLNGKGETQRLVADGFLARVIQHELDHLSGKLIIDYLNPIKKLFLKNKTSGGLTITTTCAIISHILKGYFK